MKYNKGFASVIVIVAMLAVGVVGGIVYYIGNSQKNAENKIVDDSQLVNKENFQEKTFQPKNNPVSQSQKQQINTSCLVITTPTINQTVSFPLTVTGYIDTAGAKAGTCTRWGAFEGTAGNIVVKDMNGNTKSLSVKIHTVGDYYVGMQQWPITATIQGLTGVPYTSQIMLTMTGDVQADGEIAPTQVLQPLTVTPYP